MNEPEFQAVQEFFQRYDRALKDIFEAKLRGDAAGHERCADVANAMASAQMAWRRTLPPPSRLEAFLPKTDIERSLAGYTIRVPIIIRAHRTADARTLYAVIVSPGVVVDGAESSRYSLRFGIEHLGSGFQVVSREGVCPNCELTGVVAKRPCPHCEGRGWHGPCNGPLDWGELLGEHRDRRPTSPQDALDWDTPGGLAWARQHGTLPSKPAGAR